MKETYSAYVPRDRLDAIASKTELPSHSTGGVLFADISGFTPLTEAYEAHLGSRYGGEELTRILNEVYAMLIGEVDRLRGTVIGFAGDAITCWFDGDDGLRAVGCGLAMQRGMDAFKAVPSPGGGAIELGLKAAVTTGSVSRFAVGQPLIQRVDVLAGDPVYRVAVVEQMANRGEVLVDERTRKALGASLETSEVRRGEGVVSFVATRLQRPPEANPWDDMEQTLVPRELIDPWMISAIRNRLATGLGEFFTELRPATAMFVKFEGIDFENDARADQKLDQFFSQVQSRVDLYEGVVHQLTVGDKGSFLYAAFGAPISHEDDTLRCLDVALQLKKLADSLEFISAIRIGIARGSTRTGAYGGPTRRAYGVLGDQVNLAARLMGKAQPGQILVSEAAAEEGRRAFSLAALNPIRVKGKSQPVRVFRLDGAAQNASRRKARASHETPLIGREQELARISEATDRVLAGRGQFISIVADAGLGKSRLTAEAAHIASEAGFRVFHGECQAFGGNTQYTPWWAIWRDYFGLQGDEAPEVAEELLRSHLGKIDENLTPRLPLLAPVLNIPLPDNDLTSTFDAKLRRASLQSLLVDCLRSTDARQPVLIALEDCQAMDMVSRELLRMLIQAIARLPILIVLSYRPTQEKAVLSSDEEALSYHHRLQLKELTLAQSAQLIARKVAQLYGEEKPLPPTVIERISQRTGRNPFFIDEVINWIHHEKIDIQSANSLDSVDLPNSLHALVLSRLDQLDESARATIKVASVIGRLFRVAVIWGIYPELGGEPEIVAALDRLSRRDFTERDDDSPELTYLFKHVVMHEVAYESLPKELRSKLHESIGLFIEGGVAERTAQVLDLLAFHFGRSKNTDKKRKYFLEAGDAARAAYSNIAAASYYKSVLPLLETFDQVPVLQSLGLVLEYSGNWDGAIENYHKALDLANALNRPNNSAWCKQRLGDVLIRKGSFDEAADWLRQAQASFEALQHDEGIGQALHSSGTLAAQLGQYERARDFYIRSMEIRRRLGDEAKVASLLSNLGIIARFQGDLNQALSLQKESLGIRQKINDPWAVSNSLNNLGMAKRYVGDLSGAREDLESALQMIEKVGDRAELANTLNSLAEVALDQKDFDSATSYLQESLRLRRELSNMRAIAFLFEAFAAIAYHQNRRQRCLKLHGAARQLRASTGALLPESDQAQVSDTIAKASAALPREEAQALMEEGEALPLIDAIDFAADGRD